ncbi:MAG: hypothetical protein ACJ8AW_26315 [Rhodopila sp.]
MQRFVADLLAAEGALVERIEPDGLEAVVPPPLQQALGVGELCRFGFGATLPVGAERVGIESDWLGRFARVIDERGRWHRRVIDPGARKAPDAEHVLEQELGLENATWRLLDVIPAWTRYLVPEFRFTALSDEKREGTRRLAINLATGAMPDALLDRMLPLPGEDEDAALPPGAALPPDWEPARLTERLRETLPWRVDATLAPFVAGLRRRLGRDLDRLHAYHNDLHREAALRSAQLPPDDPGRQRETLRMAAIAQEYRAKLDDLAYKYALRVTVEWVQTLELVMPVYRLAVQIRRRKAERVIRLDWNMLARRLEPPPDEAGWSAERPRLVCDDALHLVSIAGLAPCANCGRPYCRACHPQQCPKCSPCIGQNGG